MDQAITTCRVCGEEISGAMRFCPSCGRSLAARNPKRYVSIFAVAALLLGSGLGLKNALQWKRGDKKPAPHVQVQEPQQQPLPQDPELEALRSDLERSPEDINTLRSVAAVLADRLRNKPDAPPAIVFEALDVLSRILKMQPEDPDALLMMADLSFDQKTFTKAVEFYERYLKIAPDDLGATARYASTLTFLGRYDDSIKQLDRVLAKDPKSFPAMAYLAITYAQKGDTAKARELGGRALDLAPSDEARARFSGFVRSISAEGVTSSQAEAKIQEPQREQANGGASVSGINALVSAIRSNPIAGPKFVAHDNADPAVLKLVFRDFPMSMMPPFAKEKFFSGIKAQVAAAQLSQLNRIVFIDQASGQEMDSLTVR